MNEFEKNKSEAEKFQNEGMKLYYEAKLQTKKEKFYTIIAIVIPITISIISGAIAITIAIIKS